MNISSIGSQSSWYGSISKNTLTEDQQSALEEILSRYDSENLSAEDQKNMMDEIKDAGIKPSKALFTAISDAGFDLAPPPMPEDLSVASMLNGNSDSSSSSTDLSELLDKFKSGEISESELRLQLQQMMPYYSAQSTGNLINIEA